uniref:SLED domain-containing protein n=1 Tax=Heligmosomoides polygyrus TaxID=6339 RepID=A0A8L8Q839_HELPZ
LLSGAKSTPAAAPKQTADHKPARHRSVKSAHRSAVIGHGHQSSSKPVIQRLSDMGVNPLQSIRRGRAAKRPAASKGGTATPSPKRGAATGGSPARSSDSAKACYLGATPTISPGALERISLALKQAAGSQESSVENKVKDLLMHAKVEQQKLAKQLSQPAMANEAEEVVSSTTASVDSPRSAGLRQLVPRPTSSQANRDLAKVVGQVVYFDQFDEVRHFKERLQIRPKVMRRDEGADSGSPASSTPVQTPSPNSLSSAGQRPHDVLLLNREDIPLKDRLMTVFVNYSCGIGPYLDPVKVAGVRRKFGPYSVHHTLREAVQQILNCAKDDSVVLPFVQPAAVTQFLGVTAHYCGVPRTRFIPCVKSASDGWSYLKLLLRKLKICENFYSSTGDPCPVCQPMSDVNVDQVVAFSSPIKQWTIEKVAKELRKILDEAAVAKFVEQQIDGRSLGLLTTELLMNYMGLALGPALKVIDFVESVRKAQESQKLSGSELHAA